MMIRTQFIVNRIKLRRKKMSPIIASHLVRKGTGCEVSAKM
jgi:hypothetical protein